MESQQYKIISDYISEYGMESLLYHLIQNIDDINNDKSDYIKQLHADLVNTLDNYRRRNDVSKKTDNGV